MDRCLLASPLPLGCTVRNILYHYQTGFFTRIPLPHIIQRGEGKKKEEEEEEEEEAAGGTD